MHTGTVCGNLYLVLHRYFLHNWPQLAFLAYDGDHCFGTVVCKMDVHREQMLRGYLAMLVVEKPYRSLGTGRQHLWPVLHNRVYKPQCMLHEARVCSSLIQQLREVTETHQVH